MGMLADSIRQNESEIRRVLQVGYAVWDKLVDSVERQESVPKRDFYDEQIWTFLVGCGYALPPNGPKCLATQLIGIEVNATCSAIWFEVLPSAPRLNEGKSHIDLAVGGIKLRPGTQSGIEYQGSRAPWVALCECKWYSDIDTKVKSDQHRNQLLRVVDNALCFQAAGDYPETVYVVLVTPACFKDRKIKSRLYQYKFEEYRSDPRNIVEELKACCMKPSELYPNVERRLAALRLRWVSYQDLFCSIPDSTLRDPILAFVKNFDASGSHC
jgi:hypothetical protein